VLARARDENGRGTDLTQILTIEHAPEWRHIAGGLAFDNSGALLVGVGDHNDSRLAQRLDDLAGKILRIDRDGNPLPDNPFVDRQGVDPRIYAYGVRNPFGIAVDRENGRMYFGDNRNTAGDALYDLEAGANYGWPDSPVVLREPLLIYEESAGMAGVVVYNETALPDFVGDVFYCTYHEGGALHWSDTDELAGYDLARRDRLIGPGCSTGVTVGADGFLYYLTYGGQLLRISR
jgi:glucose/arabinose dehydrogenase